MARDASADQSQSNAPLRHGRTHDVVRDSHTVLTWVPSDDLLIINGLVSGNCSTGIARLNNVRGTRGREAEDLTTFEIRAVLRRFSKHARPFRSTNLTGYRLFKVVMAP